MKHYNIKGLDIFIDKKNIQGYKVVTASNGYKCRYNGYSNKEIISKLKVELFK
jgi:hypothetical protein